MKKSLFFIIITFLLIIPIKINAIDSSLEQFENNCYQSYKSYYLYHHSTDEFSLKVYLGISKDKSYYSIYFIDLNNSNITLYYQSEDKKYEVEKNGAGVIVIYGDLLTKYTNENSKQSTYLLINKNNKNILKLELIKKQVDINNINDFFDVDSVVIDGLNNGFNSLQSSKFIIIKMSKIEIITYIFLISIIIFSIILFVLFAFKKGMFNKSTRKKALKDDIGNDYLEIEEAKEIIDDKPIIVETIYEERNINEILKQNGINQDYSLLSIEEKNDVMLKLMILRDKDVISLEEYKEEIIKLWS